MQKDLLVLTDRSVGTEQGAKLTYRLLLPPSISYELHSLADCALRIWWAERYAGKLYLRACLSDCKIHIGRTRNGEQQFVAIGRIDTSTYVYRDEPTCPISEINIQQMSGSWEMAELTQDQAALLANRCIDISPVVLSLYDAVRSNKRVLRDYWPTTRIQRIYPKKLWKTFKGHATLSELVRVNGLDAYETSVAAALFDTHAAISLKEIMQALYTTGGTCQPRSHDRDGIRMNSPAFIPISLTTHCISRQHLRSSNTKVYAKNISVEHEGIVTALANRLDSMSIKPYVSPLVDLAVINNKSALFFEVKSVKNDDLLNQVRAAIAQLLEYRFIYKNIYNRIGLCFVAPALGSPSEIVFASNFMKDCGIYWLVWRPDNSEFESLDDLVAQFVTNTGYRVVGLLRRKYSIC